MRWLNKVKISLDHLIQLVLIIEQVGQQGQGSHSTLCNSRITIVDQLKEKRDEERAADACLNKAGE